jgi:hypothetical protein
MHRYDGIFEITMHDKVRVGEPNILMMMNGVKKFILRLIRIPQSRVKPLLLEQKFHFVFLNVREKGFESYLPRWASRRARRHSMEQKTY